MSQPSDHPEHKEPVVEHPTSNEQPDDLTGRALRQRIRQQELLAELGVLALQRTSFIGMLNHTARMTAEGLGAEYCKVMEYIPAESASWFAQEWAGRGDCRLGNRRGRSGLSRWLCVAHWEARYFEPPRKRATFQNARIACRARHSPRDERYSARRRRAVRVLEVDSTSEGEFGEHDIAFLQGAANILGMAIEQQQYQRKLQVALDRHQVLLKEVNHRVKNSLQVVSAMLQLQANSVGDPALSERLNEASGRVNAVGRAYERLAYNADYENIDLVEYLRQVIGDLQPTVAPCKIEFDAPEEIQFAADRAILVGLILNELVSNAGKYAYPDCPGGSIWVRLVQPDNKSILVSVRDEGAGLPLGFDPMASKGLGTRLVNALSKQLGAELTRPMSPIGTDCVLLVPLEPATAQ